MSNIPEQSLKFNVATEMNGDPGQASRRSTITNDVPPQKIKQANTASEEETCMVRVRKAGHSMALTFTEPITHSSSRKTMQPKESGSICRYQRQCNTHASEFAKVPDCPMACPLSYLKVGLSYHCKMAGQVRLLSCDRFLLFPLFPLNDEMFQMQRME